MNAHNKMNHTHTYSSHPDIPIFAKSYELYKLATDYLLRFPKIKRYTLGQKIDQNLLSFIEYIILAGYSKAEQKISLLHKASVKLDMLKIFVRLSWETNCLDNNKYQELASRLIEIGKMLGGWIKTVK
jgi:23S rRNA-intervening sequence protein